MNKVAVIGAGFTGLSAAWFLSQAGYEVTVIEADSIPGGLAAGFTTKDWDWSLEKHYHHIFTTDRDILRLLELMKLNELVFFRQVKTFTLYHQQKNQLDSPISLLKFPHLGYWDKLRAGLVLAILKLISNGSWLERFTAADFLTKTMGEKAWQVLWQPLFKGKFGDQAKEINAAWFWARIHARSAKLGYFKGGFSRLAEAMATKLTQQGVKFIFSQPVKKIERSTSQLIIKLGRQKKLSVDRVLMTAPAPTLIKLVPQLSQEYQNRITKLKGLAAITLVLQLNKPFFKQEIYWLNINEKSWPFLAVVEHTNLTSSDDYGGRHLIYVGKYLSPTDKLFKYDKKQLFQHYQPFLEQLAPGFTNNLEAMWLYRASFAQPIVKQNHSQQLPQIKTPIKSLYWASMQHIYPWDRGVNYAIRLGKRAVQEMMDN